MRQIVASLRRHHFFSLSGGILAANILSILTMPILTRLYGLEAFGIFAILGLLVMGITAALAFVKINNASIITVVLNFIGFATGPKSYVWKRKEFSYPINKVEKQPKVDMLQESPILKSQISKLSQAKKIIETKK
jgi:hypothetical protein